MFYISQICNPNDQLMASESAPESASESASVFVLENKLVLGSVLLSELGMMLT